MLLFLGALVGCGGGGEKVEGPVETIEVQETEFNLDPAEITLERPGTYVFRA